MGSLFLYIVTIIIVVITNLYYFSIKTYDHWKKRGIQFAKPVPFFGNSLLTIFRKKNIAENQQDIYNLFPEEKYVGMFLFRIPMLMMKDPELIHLIISKDFQHFYDRGINSDERLDLLSLHLINLKGDQWKSLRSKLSPAFSSGKLKTMCSKLEECVLALSQYLEYSISLDGNSLDIRSVMVKYTTDVIGSFAFGLDINSLQDPNSVFCKMGQDIFKPSLRIILKFISRAFHPSLPYYLNLKLLDPKVEEFFLNFVKDVVRQREENNLERKDFIQILCDLKKSDTNNGHFEDKKVILTDQILASNVFAFYLGGFETISSTMSFVLLELAMNPSIQTTVRREISDTLGLHGDQLNYDTLKDLSYLDMVLSETLRKYPIGTELLRVCTKTYPIPDSSFVIEEGTRIVIPVYSLHYDPKYFPNPESFDPERFSPKNKHRIVQGTYLPFGDGPRICIGIRFAMMEMKYAFCKILSQYEFSPCERTMYPVPFKKGVPLLGADGGIWLNVREIQVEKT